MKEFKDILFKEVEGHGLYLDVIVPDDVTNPPLIMWVHGGGWDELKRSWTLVKPMIDKGYAYAAVDYRYCDEAPYPAAMIDLKDALLFLKKHADEYGYDGSKIVVSGDSAGAHLATILGVSAGNADWEQPGEDYSVQGIIDISGPVSFLQMYPENPGDEEDIIKHVLNIDATSKGAYIRAAEASAESFVNGTEPPVLIIQGSEDPIVEYDQARCFRNTLEAAGDIVHMYHVPGGLHSMGGALVEGIMAEFLDYYLKNTKTVTEPKVAPEDFRTLPRAKKE